MICACGTEFTPHGNSKTCSPECGRKRKTLRERNYLVSHPEKRALQQSRQSDVIKFVRAKRLNVKLDRAVRLLFAP